MTVPSSAGAATPSDSLASALRDPTCPRRLASRGESVTITRLVHVPPIPSERVMHVAPALAVALAAIACGGTVATSPAHDGGGGDGAAIDDSGSTPDSGTPDAPACATGDAACNSLEVCGPEITLANMMTPAPQPAGGTIADGTYVETAATFYPTGTQTITSGPVRATLQIETTGPGAGMLVVQ